MNRLIKYLFIFLSLIISSQALSSPVLQLQDKLLKIKQFKADFVQNVIADDQSVLSSQSGYMAFSEPDKLIVVTTKPDLSVLQSKNDGIYFYDSFVQQVNIYDKDMIKNTPFVFFSKEKNNIKNYIVKNIANGFNIEFKNQDQVKAVDIVFKLNTIDKIVIYMTDGSINQMQLSNFTANFDPKVFDYKLPSNIEVNDGRKSK